MYISLLVFKKALDEVRMCYIVNCEMSQAGINKIHLSTFKEIKKIKAKQKITISIIMPDVFTETNGRWYYW